MSQRTEPAPGQVSHCRDGRRAARSCGKQRGCALGRARTVSRLSFSCDGRRSALARLCCQRRMGRVCWSCAASSPTACSPTAISVHGIAASIAWRAPSSARAIAERSSFAKAATHLGISRSALSETIRGLEEKLGVRLLNQTTRSVALTDVGERLLAELRPAAFEAGAGALAEPNWPLPSSWGCGSRVPLPVPWACFACASMGMFRGRVIVE